MNLRQIRLGLAAVLMIVAVLATCLAADVRSEIRAATKGFKDITVKARIVKADQKALAKISDDLARSYEAKTTVVKYKAPDKMTVDGKLGMVALRVVQNGYKKSYWVPSLGIRKTEDCRNDPHKLQNDLDIGLVTDELWNDYIVQEVLIEKTQAGSAYRITFVRPGSTRRNACWVEPKTCKLLKIERYTSEGGLSARFIYSKHKDYGAIWVPGQLDVYNGDGKLAGVTEYMDVKVNSGLPDSVFKL